MEPSQVRRAVEAARSTACELGLQVNDAVVIHNSDRIAVRLIPCDVLARIAPQAWEDGLQFEAEVARRLAETDSPVGELEPRAEPRVYVRDTFALTLWTYYEQVGAIAPADYAEALIRIHAGLRQIELAAPHITDRVAAWAEEVDNREQTPELPDPDRELLSNTFNRVLNAMNRWESGDQPSSAPRHSHHRELHSTLCSMRCGCSDSPPIIRTSDDRRTICMRSPTVVSPAATALRRMMITGWWIAQAWHSFPLMQLLSRRHAWPSARLAL